MMTYRVFLQSISGNGYRAIALAFPDCVAEGATPEETLEKLKASLAARLEQGEIVTVEVGEPEHPWRRWSGIFQDDPTYEEFLAAVEAYRREVDAVESDRANLTR